MQQHSINERISFLLKSFKLSARAFSEAIGEKPTITQNYVGARNSMPGADYLEKVMKHFDSINPTWLLTGEGEPFLSDKPETGITQTGNFNQAGTKNIQKVKGGRNAVVGTNYGTAMQQNGALPPGDDLKAQLALAQQEIENLRGQLIRADALVAAKEETISLLRASFNRPN